MHNSHDAYAALWCLIDSFLMPISALDGDDDETLVTFIPPCWTSAELYARPFFWPRFNQKTQVKQIADAAPSDASGGSIWRTLKGAAKGQRSAERRVGMLKTVHLRQRSVVSELLPPSPNDRLALKRRANSALWRVTGYARPEPDPRTDRSAWAEPR